MTDHVLATFDKRTRRLTVENDTPIGLALTQAIADDIRTAPQSVGCANPVQIITPEPGDTSTLSMRISGIWHDSLVEGPGRRSVVRMQGCPIRCAGCWVPQTHDPEGGYSINIQTLAAALMDRSIPRDGVTILGGEPFAQPEALRHLVLELRWHGCPDVLVYTGFKLETLLRRKNKHIDAALLMIDTLIDGRYIRELADTAGPYTGSGNQRVHTFR